MDHGAEHGKCDRVRARRVGVVKDRGHRTRAGTRAGLAAVLAIAMLAASRASVAAGPHDGAAVFKARCAKCHGESGKADTANARALKVRPLVDTAKLAQMTPAEIVRVIKAGPKHEGMGVLPGPDDADLEAVARFVKELAKP